MEGVPGFVPRVLRDPGVGLFRADERVFDAQMLARGLTTATIEGRCRLVRRFQEFTGEFPWTWRPVDLDDFLAERRSGDKPISLTTLRADSNAVAMFCAYLTHPSYGWAEFCQRTFGDVPSQICFSASSGTRRGTRPTMRCLRVYGRSPRPSSSGSSITSIAFKVCYAYGLRRREVTMLDLHDFGPNPHVPAFGSFGAVTIRWAMGSLGDSFAQARNAVGLPKELGLHCLRHSYVTHLIEAGYDPAFVQTQVGHSYASTTGLYTSVSADFKQKTLQQMIARRTAKPEEVNTDA